MSEGKNTRLLLLKISRKVTKAELKEMKYICDKIPEGSLEKIDSVLDLFKKIPEFDEKGDGGVSYISYLLTNIGREDLSNELLGIEVNDQKPQKQNVEGKCFRIVEKMVAADWRELGRHLNLDNYILEEIDLDRKSVRDKCAAVLEHWKKVNGVDMGILKGALFDMGRKDIVDKISNPEDTETKGNMNPVAQETCAPGKNMEGSAESSSKENESESVKPEFYKVDNTTYVQAPKKHSGLVSSKYQINVHPGSNVMVGDCGSMTIYTNARVDQRALRVGKHDMKQSRTDYSTVIQRDPVPPRQ